MLLALTVLASNENLFVFLISFSQDILFLMKYTFRYCLYLEPTINKTEIQTQKV